MNTVHYLYILLQFTYYNDNNILYIYILLIGNEHEEILTINSKELQEVLYFTSLTADVYPFGNKL